MNKPMQGSLQNRLFERSSIEVVPYVGMGATEIWYSDREAYTVIEIVSAKKLLVQRDRAIPIGSITNNEYKLERDPMGAIKEVHKLKDGSWYQGKSMKNNRFLLGIRMEYYDPSF